LTILQEMPGQSVFRTTGFVCPASLVGHPHLDSRLRGNDRRECPPEADRGFGGVPRCLNLPPGVGARQLTQANVMMVQSA